MYHPDPCLFEMTANFLRWFVNNSVFLRRNIYGPVTTELRQRQVCCIVSLQPVVSVDVPFCLKEHRDLTDTEVH
jgi:hypothetical protein